MKLYISTRSLIPPSSGGAYQYTIGIANALSLIPGVKIIIGTTGANSCSVGKLIEKSINVFELAGEGGCSIAKSEEELVAAQEVSWCIYPYPNRYDRFSGASNVKYCSIIFDLQHIAFPDFFSQAERWKREESYGNAICSADLIATISSFSSTEIRKSYGGMDTNPAVIYAGTVVGDQTLSRNTVSGGPFLLYPANAWAHKNHDMLFKAFKLLKNKIPKLELLLTGDYKRAPATFYRHLKLPGVRHRGYVSSEELSALRAQAACVVFPSLYEGFGMPIIESLRQGTPVACSNSSSLPEVGGDAVEYFDPKCPGDIATAVERAIENRNISEWQQKAREQASKFSFERTAHLLIAAIRGVSSGAELNSLQERTQVSDQPDLPKFWKSYPGVDGILLMEGSSYSKTIRLKDLKALHPLDAARLNPGMVAALIIRGELMHSSGSQWSINEYKRLLELVKENKLIVYTFTSREGNQKHVISRLEAFKVFILQLKYLKRTCRECLIAVLMGRWG